MKRFKAPLMYLLSFLMVWVGFTHLWNPQQFLNIMPPALPNPEWLNVISGLFEITLGVFLLERRVRYLAAWGLIALYIAVFPANLYVAVENVNMATGEAGTGDSFVNWARIPFQAVFMLWAWWYTRDDEGSSA